tara:strand:+ start:51 stop:1298 length:1248 start_codon:yes stop_codon:yes gene_type:complete
MKSYLFKNANLFLTNIIDEVDMVSAGIAQDTGTPTEDSDTREVIEELTQAVRNQEKKIPRLLFPQVSDKPLNEFHEPNLFANCYPWLFPGGSGDASSTSSKSKDKSLRWTRTLLNFYDGRFARDPIFTFHIMNFVQRHVNNKDAVTFVKQYITDKDITIDDIKEQIARGNYSFISKLQQFSSEKIRGSDGWWRLRKSELDSWIAHHLEKQHGPPTLFMTFSCAEYWWKDLESMLYKRCRHTEDEQLAHDMIYHHSSKIRNTAKQKLLERHTTIVQQFFQHRMDNWLETVGKSVFNIEHYFLRFEFTKGRGQIHAHMIAITSDNDFIAEYYSKTSENKTTQATKVYADYARNVLSLTAEKPKINQNEDNNQCPLSGTFSETKSIENDLANLVQQTHMHKCNNFCMRYRKRYVSYLN